jgi:hypothetical protein
MNLHALTIRLATAALLAATAGLAADDAAAAPAEEYIPFVTDFPRPVEPAGAPAAGGGGIDWSGLTADGGLAAAVAAALAGAVLLLLRRRHAPWKARSG